MSSTLSGTTVMLADDHSVVRMGFRLLLEGAGAKSVCEVGSGEEAMTRYPEVAPDVLIMDVSMPGIGGLSALKRILCHHPGAKVLIVSAHDDLQISGRALHYGARGYLSKRASPDEFIKAVSLVARGINYVDHELALRIALSKIGAKHNSPLDVLSEKEFAVFLDIAGGKTVADVARIRRLSTSTIGTHLYRIKQKLNVTNSAELALIAVRSGLIEI